MRWEFRCLVLNLVHSCSAQGFVGGGAYVVIGLVGYKSVAFYSCAVLWARKNPAQKNRCKDENNKWSEKQKTKQEADEGKRQEGYERTESILDEWKMLLISTLRFALSSWCIWTGLSWWLLKPPTNNSSPITGWKQACRAWDFFT